MTAVHLFAAFLLASAAPRTVVLEPCGEVTFTNVPRRAIVADANYAEMIALTGRRVEACISKGARFERNVFWDRLPGYSPTNTVTGATLAALPGEGAFAFDREFFYAWRPDVIHIDPLMLGHAKGWEPAKIDDVRTRLAPFFANRFSRDWAPPRDRPDYTFYTIPELAEKMAVAYDATAHVAKILAFVKEAEDRIAAKVASVKNPPRVALVYGGGRVGCVLPFRLNRGNGQAQYRVLRVRDAFDEYKFRTYGDGGAAGGSCDFETLLKIDPDVIIIPFAGAMRPGDMMYADYQNFLKQKDHPVARHLKAFKNGRVYPGGTPLQGPVVYLFQLEMAAKQLYPELFGTWREDGAYPESEQLFDRAALVRLLLPENMV